MQDDRRDEIDALRAELARVSKYARTLERRLEQAARDTATAETISVQSKRAMLRTNEELTSTIQQLQSTARELREAKARAEQANEAKGRFLATMSHEIRTPMNGILGAVELLLTTDLDAEQSELAELMHASGHSLLRLIDEVLDFSKIEAGRVELENVPFHLPECLRSVVDLQRRAALAKGLEVRWHCAPGLPVRVLGDPTRLRQVLLNLLNNAIKFTAKGSVELRAARAAPGDDVLRFSVRDTGVGIKPDALDRIFEAFTQEDETTTRRFGGTGLGLAICKQLAHLMGGDVTVESTVGAGSTFHLTCRLPEVRKEKASVAATDALQAPSKFPGRRVLVVDDVEGNRLIATKMLERLGCVVTCASNGLEALQCLDGGEFDCVFLDCAMPVLDGFEAATKIRARTDAARDIPIVAMTAYGMASDQERCRAAGMNDYVAKPLTGNAVAGALERVLRQPTQPVPPTAG